jgi:hypothetical protein
MRTLVLVSFTLAASIGAGGCRPSPGDAPESAFQVPKRDLTLQQTNAPQIEVASPVELARAAPAEPRNGARQRSVRRPSRAAHTAASAARKAAATATPVPVPASSGVAALPVSQAAYDPPDPNALAPGQTVTVLPASSGSASEPGWTDQGPPDARHGDSGGATIRGGGRGGSCGGRGHPGGGGAPGLRGLR